MIFVLVIIQMIHSINGNMSDVGPVFITQILHYILYVPLTTTQVPLIECRGH